MVAGILSAGPPKKKSSKYSRALTQPIQPADRSELATQVIVNSRIMFVGSVKNHFLVTK